MRTLLNFGTFFLMFLSFQSFAQKDTAQDSTGLPGDNFSLEGAIALFKQSTSPEDFEKQLNAEQHHINNLDLNEDGETDYIRVVDNMDGDVHALVLQVDVSEKETQDVAVIEIEKQGAESAILQIVGNEEIYGEQQIAEPFEEEKIDNGRGKNGPAAPQIGNMRIVVNVWLWPSVRFMYAPAYRVWVSPWHWRAYPTWWRPWRPYPIYRYHAWVHPYRAHCHIVTTHRVVRAHAVYTPHRRSSAVVKTRTTTVVAHRGKHGTTIGKKTTTTTTGPRGQRSTTTKTTARKGQNGNVRVQKSTTTKRRRG